MGILGGLRPIGVRLYEVWEVYGDLWGSKGVLYMMFGNCLGTIRVIGGCLYEVWEVYGDPRGSKVSFI